MSFDNNIRKNEVTPTESIIMNKVIFNLQLANTLKEQNKR